VKIKTNKNSKTEINIQNIKIVNLTPANFYQRLFPFEKGIDDLVKSLSRSFQDEFPLIVREKKHKKGIYEIISGVRRWRAAKELHFTEINCLVKNMTDSEAIIYCAKTNLAVSSFNYKLSLIQSLTLKLIVEEEGRNISHTDVMKVANCKIATYKKATSCLKFVVDKLKKEFFQGNTELKNSEIISESIEKNHWKPFSDLYFGHIKIDDFRNTYYINSELGEQKRRKYSPKMYLERPKFDEEKLLENLNKTLESLWEIWEEHIENNNEKKEIYKKIEAKFNNNSSKKTIEIIAEVLKINSVKRKKVTKKTTLIEQPLFEF
jgi:hypothetical protein